MSTFFLTALLREYMVLLRHVVTNLYIYFLPLQPGVMHYDSKHRKMFRQILKATGNTPIHRILMQMHDIKYIYCHFCRKQGRRLQGQAQGIKMTNNK